MVYKKLRGTEHDEQILNQIKREVILQNGYLVTIKKKNYSNDFLSPSELYGTGQKKIESSTSIFKYCR